MIGLTITSRATAALATLFLMSACATQPPYQAPVSTLPPEWANGAERPDTALVSHSTSSEASWGGLHDPAIDALVAAALTDNPTLAEAAARVDEARAALTIQRSRRLPRIDAAASAVRERTGSADGDTGATTTVWQSSAAIGPSFSWEIDLWGRVREAGLAAHSRLQARSADAADARLSIAAQVADNVLTLRACDLLLTVRDADIASRENELAIIRTRVRLGSLAPVEAAGAESNLAAVRINRIAQEEECLRTVDALVALSGRSATEVRATVAAPTSGVEKSPSPEAQGRNDDLSVLMPSAPAILPGLPATVLLVHPSVVAAEREVAARWSEIAIARAERLPRLDLTALLTGQWISSLGSTVSLVTGSIAGDISAPLIDGGSGRAEIARTDARYREAVASLNVTLRQAIRDVEDGLAAQDSAARRLEASRSALSAARQTLRGNEARRRAGSIGAFEMEESRRQFNRAQENTIVAARDRAQARVELIRRTGSILDVDRAALHYDASGKAAIR